MPAMIAVVTNVNDYVGPPAAAALAAEEMTVLCHSAAFAEPDARDAFERGHAQLSAAHAQTPEDLIEEALQRFGRVDVVVSNDAANVRAGPFDERSADDYRTLFEAFAVNPCRLAMAALPRMKSQRSGRIIFVTSGAPLRPAPGLALYAATRAASNSLVKSLAAEFGPFGISVNAVAPYLVASNYFPRGMDDPAIAKRVQQAVPMQRMGRPEEAGALIALLASGTADFVSGQVIALSGGGA
jgi:NAD(P)-dependent dehydrogenase (short-subunit alcohol dehydrogenase family)